MEDGDVAETLNPWAVALFRTLETVDPKSAPEQSGVRRSGSTRRPNARRPGATGSTEPRA